MMISSPNNRLFEKYFESGENSGISQFNYFHTVFCGSHLIHATKETRINGPPQYIIWKVCPDTILRSSVAKIQRNLKMAVYEEVCIDSKLPKQI